MSCIVEITQEYLIVSGIKCPSLQVSYKSRGHANGDLTWTISWDKLSCYVVFMTFSDCLSQEIADDECDAGIPAVEGADICLAGVNVRWSIKLATTAYGARRCAEDGITLLLPDVHSFTDG